MAFIAHLHVAHCRTEDRREYETKQWPVLKINLWHEQETVTYLQAAVMWPVNGDAYTRQRIVTLQAKKTCLTGIQTQQYCAQWSGISRTMAKISTDPSVRATRKHHSEWTIKWSNTQQLAALVLENFPTFSEVTRVCSTLWTRLNV